MNADPLLTFLESSWISFTSTSVDPVTAVIPALYRISCSFIFIPPVRVLLLHHSLCSAPALLIVQRSFLFRECLLSYPCSPAGRSRLSTPFPSRLASPFPSQRF